MMSYAIDAKLVLALEAVRLITGRALLRSCCVVFHRHVSPDIAKLTG